MDRFLLFMEVNIMMVFDFVPFMWQMINIVLSIAIVILLLKFLLKKNS